MLKEQIIDLTIQLISISSTKTNEDDLNRVLEISKRQLKDFKHKYFVSNKNPSLLFYNTDELPEKFKIILNAHLDVVPGKPSQYKSEIKNGKLYGRGAIDMKTAGAVFILLFKKVAKNIDYPLGLQLVTDEEIGGFNGTKHQIKKGISTEFVIAGEPTNMAINTKAKGIINLDLTTKGSSSHGAYPWKGQNALVKLNEVISDILKEYPIPDKEEWKTTFNLSWITTDNNTTNKVPDNAKARFDIRYVPEDKDIIKEKIEQIVANRAQIKYTKFEPSQLTNLNNLYVKKMEQTYEEFTGKECELIHKHGGSDLRHYERVGIDGMLFGPVGEGAHTDHEYVDLEKLIEYYEILEKYLLEINE